jgi:glycerophosphoryl diester phosphodiesterase
MVPLVIAHRGASWDEPENTLPAFRRAIEIGADYIEFDVHATRDGALVVTHDPPAESSVRELVRLEEVLELARGRIGVMVELKQPYRYRGHDIVARTLELLDDDAVVVSFERQALVDVRRLRPALRTIQHVGFGVSIRRAGNAWGVGFLDRLATPRAIRAARALGLATTVYTVNAPKRMQQLAELGVSGIFTDRPELALRTLAPRRG